MKTHMLVAMMTLLAFGARAQIDEDVPLTGLTNYPQASGNMPPTPLTSEQEQQVLHAVFSRFPNVDARAMMEYIAVHFPDEMQRYTLLAMENLGEAMTLLMGLVRESVDLQQLESRKPEQYALRMRQRDLERRTRELAAAGDTDALRGVVVEAFNVKQALMQAEIADIEQQVDDLQRLLNEREQNREAIIARRVESLAGGRTEW